MTVIGTGTAKAGQNLIQVSLFNPIQLINEDKSVEGFRWNFIYTANQNMTGFDLGFISKTKGNFLGVGYCAANIVEGNMKGIQIGVFNTSNSVNGVQLGFVNMTKKLNGLQLGLLNLNDAGPFKMLPLINFAL